MFDLPYLTEIVDRWKLPFDEGELPFDEGEGDILIVEEEEEPEDEGDG
jgi:hypothetical protein